MEKQLGDWKQKCEELVGEVEGCQKESRQHASELFKLKTAHEESLEQLEALRRESKAYQGTNIFNSYLHKPTGSCLGRKMSGRRRKRTFFH